MFLSLGELHLPALLHCQLIKHQSAGSEFTAVGCAVRGTLILVTELQSYNEHGVVLVGDDLLAQSPERQLALVVHLPC